MLRRTGNNKKSVKSVWRNRERIFEKKIAFELEWKREGVTARESDEITAEDEMKCMYAEKSHGYRDWCESRPRHFPSSPA